jgi:hypothetical protein
MEDSITQWITARLETRNKGVSNRRVLSANSAFTGTILGVTVANIEVDPTVRRRGYATRIVETIESAVSYVMIQAISSDEMDQLAKKLNYESMPYSDDSNRIKKLRGPIQFGVL